MIDDPNWEDLINFVNRHFAAEMPCFNGKECQNIYVGYQTSKFPLPVMPLMVRVLVSVLVP
jgi:hypothetical protein